MSKKNNKVIAINTNKYLPYSETFIKNHIDGLFCYTAVVIASERLTNGLRPKSRPELILKDFLLGNFWDFSYKLGFVPKFMKNFVNENKVSLIHSHFGQNGYAAVRLALKMNLPHITTFHGLDITINKVDPNIHGRLLKKFHSDLEFLGKNGTLFIAVSNFIKSKLIEKGFPEDKIVTNYIGVDTDFFKPINVKKNNTILCISRHVECKGIEYLIHAMKDIIQEFPEWKLVLIGDGPLTLKYKKLAKTISDNIEFRGRLSSDEIKRELSSAKIYSQPSVKLNNGQEEALALTIVEAQAMGLPAVVFNSGGMPEAISPGKSGFVVEEKNVKELANKIKLLMREEQLLNKFSAEAVMFANEHHCLTKQISKLESIYDNLLRERN